LNTVQFTSHTYTLLSEILCFFKAVCSPPSRSRRVTQIMSVEALLFNGFGHTSTITSTILRIRTTMCMHTWQSPYEIIGDCSNESTHRYRIITVPGAQEEARRNGVETDTRKNKSSSCDISLRVMTYFVC